MADKFRNTFPISVTFAAGEEPTHTKLNGLSSQAKNGLSLVEYAIGDLWNQAGDSIFDLASGLDIMIPNLARFTGQSKLINPRVPYLGSIDAYTYDFTSELGTHDARLPFPVHVSSTFSWAGGGSPTVRQPTKAQVTSSSDWWVDYDTGDCYFYSAIGSGWKLTYKPVVYGDLGLTGWNVIPDPYQSTSYAFKSVKIQYVNGSNDTDGYYIFLPPRGPLTASRKPWFAPQDPYTAPVNSSNFQTGTLSSADRLFWQSDSVDADTSSNASHYRYALPLPLTANWSQAATLPAGFMYLYDSTYTGTIIDGVTFYAENAAVPRTYVLVAKGSNLSTWLTTTGAAVYTGTAAPSSTAQSAAAYPANGLKLIIVGTSVTSHQSIVEKSYLDHDHGENDGRQVKHSDLAELFPASGIPQLTAGYGHGRGDDHPQYFERHGYDLNRDKYGNMVLGDIVLSSTNSTNDYQNAIAVSNKIRFSFATAGSSIYYDNSFGPAPGAICLDNYSPGDIGEVRFRNDTAPTDYFSFVTEAPNYRDTIKVPNPLVLEAQTGTANVVSGILDQYGFKLKAPSGDFAVDRNYCEIVRPLGPGFGNVDVSVGSGWAPATSDGWQTVVDAQNIYFYINDVPNGYFIDNIVIYYKISTNNASLMKFNAYTKDVTTGSDSAMIAEQTYGGTSGVYTPSAAIVPLITNNTIDTQFQVLVFRFTSNGSGGETRQIYPYVKLGGYFNLISPWSSG